MAALKIELEKIDLNLTLFCVEKFLNEISELESKGDYRYGKKAHTVTSALLNELIEQKALSQFRNMLTE